MNRRKIVILAIIAMVLTLMPGQLSASSFSIQSSRLYGEGRIDTALEVCNAGWVSAETVIIAPANQENLVDALAVAPLAGQEDAPILLTFKNQLDSKVRSKIIALGAKKVYVVGAIQDNVKNEITSIGGITVEALKGSSRWETVKVINSKLNSPEGSFIVGYNSLADALSVSSFAAANNYAIILADINGNIPAGQYILGFKAYLVGGPTLVRDIAGATRLAGTDRFGTNIEVLDKLTFDYDKVYIANGFNEHLVDSLVAAPLAARYNAPIVLASDYSIPSSYYIKGKLHSASEVVALGGPAVVSDSIRDSIAPRDNDNSSSGSFLVKDITPISLNSFKVTFSKKVDEDTAENVENYKVDGSELDDTEDSAVLLSDGKTVIVMVDQESASDMAPFTQNQKILVEVKKDYIYDEDKNETAPEFSKEITMFDITTPKLTSVEAYGNTKLVVEFSEPVSVEGITSEVRKWKIDGTNISSLGLNSSQTTAKNPTKGTAFPIAMQVELYFSSALSSGSHTLKVVDGTSGTNGWLVDGANFVVQESTKDFRIENVTSAPKVDSVECINNEVHVKFNRAMYKDPSDPNGGTGSALNTSYYDINDEGESGNLGSSPLSSNPTFKEGSGDTIVKFNIDSGVIKKGINVIEIDKDIKDAWGNKLDDDDNIRTSFTYKEDNTQPWVVSVSCLSDTKVRVRFSENMDKDYAQNRSNYSIKDSDGVEVFGKDAGGTAKTVPADEDSDTVELIMPSGEYLRESDYTIKIKDICDTSLDRNFIDTYTATFDGYDDFGPELEGVVVDGDDDSIAICFFSEKLDDSTVRTSNFGYVDGAGEHRDLPSGTKVSLDGTGKIVTIDFPSAYTVKTTNGGAGDTNDKYEVNKIRASNVEDLDGNVISGIAMTVSVANTISDSHRPHFISNSFCLYDDGDDVRAEFELSQNLSDIEIDDFAIGASGVGYNGGVTPNTGYVTGETVVLKFSADNKVRAIEALGPNAYLYSKAQNSIRSESYSGIKMLEFPGAGYQVYDEQIRPRILNDDPAVDPIVLTNDGDDAIIEIAFSEPIDGTIVGLYDDDFSMTCGGGSLTVKSVAVDTVNKNIVKFNVGPVADLPGSTIHVRAYESKIDIRDLKDRGQEDHNKYVPTRDDKDGYSVSDTTAPTITSVIVNSATDKVTVTFNERIFAPNSFADFKIDSPYDEGKATPAVAGTAWTWAADYKSVLLTFGASDFKANDTYVLAFTSPGSSKYRDLGANYLATVTKTGRVNDAAADTTAPTVTVAIGDDANNGETIASGASAYVRFSEVLSAASKAVVEAALTAGNGGAGALSYAWDDNTAKLTVTSSGGPATFAADVTCNIADETGNSTAGAAILTQ